MLLSRFRTTRARARGQHDRTEPSALGAVRGTDAVLVLTEWPEFKTLDLGRIRGLLNMPILLDGKNLMDPAVVSAAGITYYGVGTAPMHGVPVLNDSAPASHLPAKTPEPLLQTA